MPTKDIPTSSMSTSAVVDIQFYYTTKIVKDIAIVDVDKLNCIVHLHFSQTKNITFPEVIDTYVHNFMFYKENFLWRLLDAYFSKYDIILIKGAEKGLILRNLFIKHQIFVLDFFQCPSIKILINKYRKYAVCRDKFNVKKHSKKECSKTKALSSADWCKDVPFNLYDPQTRLTVLDVQHLMKKCRRL